MLEARYKEYTKQDWGLPFVYLPDVAIDPYTCSEEANWHENLEIEVCTSGSGYVLIDGEKFDFECGDVIVLNSNSIHYTGTTGSLKYDCFVIDLPFCKDVDIEYTSLKFENLIKSKNLFTLAKRFKKAYFDCEKTARTARLCAILLEMLIELKEEHLKESSERIDNETFVMVTRCVRYIRENYDKKIYVDDLATHLLTDKYTLARKFKKFTKQTVVEYINRYRCLRASGLINGGMPVSEAAAKCGFNNMSFFTRTYKKYMGTLPSKIKGYPDK